jgi:hypothetical protein
MKSKFGGRDEVPTNKKVPVGDYQASPGHLFLLRIFFQEIGTICLREMSGTPIQGLAGILDVPNWL